MSKYTTELRYICETAAGLTESTGYNNVNEVIAAAREKIFDFSYPIFDEAYKEVLETKILKHFYTQEIGSETVGRWKLMLDATMNEIMPWYNKLYESGLQDLNPFYTDDLTESYEKTGTESQTETGSTTESSSGTNANTSSTSGSSTNSDSRSGEINNSGTITDTGNSTDSGSESTITTVENGNTRWDKYSDTPQGTVDNLEDDTYLTNARKITDAGNSSTTATTAFGKIVNTTNERELEGTETSSETGSSTETTTQTKEESGSTTGSKTGGTTKDSSGNSTESYLMHRVGRSGLNVIDIMERLRDTMIDIDMMIIEDLKPLFMRLW